MDGYESSEYASLFYHQYRIQVSRRLIGNELIRIGIATYLLLWPEDGIMKKEDIRGIYDGSIFYKKAEEVHQRKQNLQEKRIA